MWFEKRGYKSDPIPRIFTMRLINISQLQVNVNFDNRENSKGCDLGNLECQDVCFSEMKSGVQGGTFSTPEQRGA